MKKLNLIIGFLIALSIISCSSDDNKEESQNQGGILIGNIYYDTPYAYINDENTLNSNPSDLAVILSNKELLPDNIDSGINILYVDYRGVDFEVGSKDLLNYRITKNASRVNGLIQGGERLLEDNFNSDVNATQINFKINSISSTNIDVEFSFTREDGLLISGSYSGTYVNVSD
ncbi:MAG: hypothetical protein COA67_12145 [Lutibacter sp.]|nr:MAG: hypothetical protein COA67_12145 [Lutibacter sp.]